MTTREAREPTAEEVGYVARERRCSDEEAREFLRTADLKVWESIDYYRERDATDRAYTQAKAKAEARQDRALEAEEASGNGHGLPDAAEADIRRKDREHEAQKRGHRSPALKELAAELEAGNGRARRTAKPAVKTRTHYRAPLTRGRVGHYAREGRRLLMETTNELAHAQKMVVLHLFGLMEARDFNEVAIGRHKLAEATGLHPSTVRNALETLAADRRWVYVPEKPKPRTVREMRRQARYSRTPTPYHMSRSVEQLVDQAS